MLRRGRRPERRRQLIETAAGRCAWSIVFIAADCWSCSGRPLACSTRQSCASARHSPMSRPDAGGGQGMWVAHQLCDLVEIRTSPAGTQIRVHMQLRPAGRPTLLPRHHQPLQQPRPRWHRREPNR